MFKVEDVSFYYYFVYKQFSRCLCLHDHQPNKYEDNVLDINEYYMMHLVAPTMGMEVRDEPFVNITRLPLVLAMQRKVSCYSLTG